MSCEEAVPYLSGTDRRGKVWHSFRGTPRVGVWLCCTGSFAFSFAGYVRFLLHRTGDVLEASGSSAARSLKLSLLEEKHLATSSAASSLKGRAEARGGIAGGLFTIGG